MKTTVSVYDFRQAFHDCGRGNQFSYEALGLLFEYFEEYEESTGEETELDPIAICCEFSEENPLDIAESYGIDLEGVDLEDNDQIIEAVSDFLQVNTALVGVTKEGTIVYQSY